MKFQALLAAGLVALAVTGCGSKTETPPANIGTPTTDAGTAAPKQDAPDAVVTAFLESLRVGNDALASSLLTDIAQQETQKKGLKVQPPGTPDMTYTIGQTEYVTEAKDGAHVGSVWSEKLETGEMASFEVIWVLRLQPQGWRIAGMATPVGDNSEPLFLNFENPDDLLQKWQASETQMVEGQPAGQNLPEIPAAENAKKSEDANPLR
jgi:predicted small lipoprotein YifL